MKHFDTELKKYADKVQLKKSEQRELRERILSYMEYHPLKKQSSLSRDLHEGIASESFVTFQFTKLHARLLGGVFVLVLVVAPFMAEKSVPGDALYFVKTSVTEPVQKTFVSSPYEAIEFETKLMERRIAEARSLASEGKLTDAVKMQITETVKEHTSAVQDGLTKLRTEDADSAAIAQIAFNSSLEVQSVVLGESIDATAGDSSVDTILTAVNEAREQIIVNQGEQAAPSYEGLSARIELETTRAYELFTTIKVSATVEEIQDIDRRLSDINRLTLEAKELYVTEPERAVQELASTLGLIQKLVVFMTDIDVRATVSLESLLPIVLSDGERVTMLRTEMAEIQTLAVALSERLGVIEDGGMQEKVEDGLVQIEAFFGAIESALEDGDIAGAENLLGEARAVSGDLDVLTQTEESVSELELSNEDSDGTTGTSTDSVGTTTDDTN